MIDEFSFPMCLDPGRVKWKWVFCLKIARFVFVVDSCVFLVGTFSILSHLWFMHLKWWRIFLLRGVFVVFLAGLCGSWAR